MSVRDGLQRVVRPARYLASRDWSLVSLARQFRGASALEPGGPSALFEAGGVIPVYPRLSSLDVLDYAERTMWTELAPSPGKAPRRRGPVPRRVIGEAGALRDFADGSYDAVLSSHVIEHLANPIGALREWRRVLRPGGLMLIVAPHLEGTFDHRREVTSLSHLREDAERATGEEDITHLEEVLALHDATRDPATPDRAVFEARVRTNVETRAIHHHTFTARSFAELLADVGLPLVALKAQRPFNIICFCRLGARPMPAPAIEKALSESPFAADRRPAAARS